MTVTDFNNAVTTIPPLDRFEATELLGISRICLLRLEIIARK